MAKVELDGYEDFGEPCPAQTQTFFDAQDANQFRQGQTNLYRVSSSEMNNNNERRTDKFTNKMHIFSLIPVVILLLLGRHDDRN